MTIEEALKALRESPEAEQAKELAKEVRRLKAELETLYKEVDAAREEEKSSNAELQELENKRKQLEDQAEALSGKYLRWVKRSNGYDDIEIYDRKAQSELEPQVKELKKQAYELGKTISDIVAKIRSKGTDEIKAKKDEITAAEKASAESVNSLLEKEKPEIDKILDILNSEFNYRFFDIVPEECEIIDDDLCVVIRGSQTYEVEEDDFDWDSDDLAFKGVTKYEELFAEEAAADVIANREDWDRDGDSKFFKLPFGDWKLLDDAEIYGQTSKKGEPYISGYSYDTPSFDDPGGGNYDSIENDEIEVTVDLSFYKPLSSIKEENESLDEGFFDNAYAEKAWMLNNIISYMNNEEAYYASGWLEIWPDGESQEECLNDFNTKEDYEELEDLFIEIYKEYHDDGMYRLSDSGMSDDEWKMIIDKAHEWDKKLNLTPIEDLSAKKVTEDVDEKPVDDKLHVAVIFSEDIPYLLKDFKEAGIKLEDVYADNYDGFFFFRSDDAAKEALVEKGWGIDASDILAEDFPELDVTLAFKEDGADKEYILANVKTELHPLDDFLPEVREKIVSFLSEAE